MRSLALVPVLATFLGLGAAKPTPTEPEQPSKRAVAGPVTVSGNAFWQGSTRFYIRGIDYQPGGSSDMRDPLADSAVCHRDIAEFKKLGINTVRVYIVDNSANHDTCMKALADAGIYAIIDANNPLYSINRENPGPSYNTEYLQSVFATIDEFVKYDNTLAFFSGNEVINDNVSSTLAAPYVKAVTRDMRQYIRSRSYRDIPVGYSAADVAQNRMQLAHYMNCGTDDERSDFFAFNDYSYCNTDFKTAGWDQKVKNFTGYGIPIFLSEYGCILNGRDFKELGDLMSDKMTGEYSGGLMYEYSWEPNNYGIVNISSPKASSVQELPEFAKFKKALAAYPPPSGDGGFTKTTNSVPCPAKDADWLVGSTLLPAIPKNAVKFMKSGAGTGPGLKGAGSQNAGGSGGDTSGGNATPGSGATEPSPSHSKNAGPGNMNPMAVEKAPFIIAGLVVLLTLTGTLLL